MPYIFSTQQKAWELLDGPIGDQLFAEAEKQGWKGLAWAERGFRNLTNSKHPVNSPADMQGLKIRLMQNPIYVDSFKALGANAVPMAWTEALTALQQGTIDGQENPLNVIVSFKLYDSQKFMTITRHAYAPAPLIMSMVTWKKLSASQRTDSASSSAVLTLNTPMEEPSCGAFTIMGRPSCCTASTTKATRAPSSCSLREAICR